MVEDNYDVLFANEVYLEACCNILNFKIKAIDFTDDCKKQKSIINIENDEHKTITIVEKKNEKYNTDIKSIILDGTNYSIDFIYSDNGMLLVKNKELGIQYLFIEEELDEEIGINKIYRVFGDTEEYFEYLNCGDMCILLEYKGIDDGIKTHVINSYAKQLEGEDLLLYAVEGFSKISNSYSVEDNDDYEQYNEEYEENSEEEINAYVDDDYTDYSIIEFISSAVPNVEETGDNKRPIYNLPEDINYFNYVHYSRIQEDSQRHMQREEEIDDSYASKSDISYNEKEKIENIIFQCITSNGEVIVDPEDYSIYIDGEEATDEFMFKDILNAVFTYIAEIQMEEDNYMVTYFKFDDELNKIKEIVSRRKNKMENGENSKNKKVIYPEDFEL